MALAKKLFFGLLLCGVLHAQNPRGISYQGVVLYPSVELPGIDSRVTPYSERDVCFRFSIYDDTDALEYSETHNTSTDYYGQVNLVIGRGDNPLIPGRLDDLKWDGTAKFLKVELDYAALCTDWEEISYSELNYVPFAFYALSSGGSNSDDQNLTGATLTGTTLQIDIENGNSTSVDLATLQDGTGTDDQNIQGLVLDATTNTLTVGIENGTSQNVSLAALVNDADANPTNEIQDLILTTKILSITNNTAATPIDLKEVLDLNDAADVTITAPATNEVLAYESGQWVNKPLKDLKLVEYASSYPAAPQSQPLKVGLPSSPNSTDLRFANIDEVDILIIDNSSDNSYITLEDLDSERDGKILKIVESSNQNPKITANSIPFYNTLDADNENYLFFNFIKIVTSGGDLNREFKHESVDFIWQGGNWTPMR